MPTLPQNSICPHQEDEGRKYLARYRQQSESRKRQFRVFHQVSPLLEAGGDGA